MAEFLVFFGSFMGVALAGALYGVDTRDGSDWVAHRADVSRLK